MTIEPITEQNIESVWKLYQRSVSRTFRHMARQCE